MESQGRSPYPISPHQGDGKPATWLATHAATIALASILFVVILGGAIALGYQHMTTRTQSHLIGDGTTASLLADFHRGAQQSNHRDTSILCRPSKFSVHLSLALVVKNASDICSWMGP